MTASVQSNPSAIVNNIDCSAHYILPGQKLQYSIMLKAFLPALHSIMCNKAGGCISVHEAGIKMNMDSSLFQRTVTRGEVKLGSDTKPISNQQGHYYVSFHTGMRPVCSLQKYMFWSLLLASILVPFWLNASISRMMIKYEMNDTTLKTFEPFNYTNPHEKSWCSSATCNNSPLCQPCMKRFLFIIATGRSGSTSLLSMLNHLPGVSELVSSIMPCLRSTETLTSSNIERI